MSVLMGISAKRSYRLYEISYSYEDLEPVSDMVLLLGVRMVQFESNRQFVCSGS